MTISQDLLSLYRYEVDTSRAVGRGGCGTVWRARDILLDQDVAIKTISPDHLDLTAARTERSFRLEAIAGARLSRSSRHIVKVLDLGRTGATLFFAMEWIEPMCRGRVDVSNMIGASSLAEARRVVLHACEAAWTAHGAGVVHSDIAPWNIVYDASMDVYKLADFGLLRTLENAFFSASGSLLQGGRLAFLPTYARTNIDLVSAASDVYALAVTLWTLISGESVQRRTSDEVPRVVRVVHNQRDAPYEIYRLLTRFVSDHRTTDSVAELREALLALPVR